MRMHADTRKSMLVYASPLKTNESINGISEFLATTIQRIEKLPTSSNSCRPTEHIFRTTQLIEHT